MITRPITRPVTSPIARAVTAGAAIWNPRALFANGEQGLIYDPNDLATLFQDSAGTTPVTAAGQPVGLMLDKRLGLIQGADVKAAGTTGILGAATAATFNPATGVATATRVDVSNQSFIYFALNGAHKIRLNNTSSTTLIVRFGPSVGSTIFTVAPYQVLEGIAVVASGGFVVTVAAGTAQFTVEYVRELPGNHAPQSTAAARPILRDTPRRIDYDGVDDALSVTFSASLGSACTVARSIPGVGAQILTGQTIGTSFTDNVDNCGLIIVNRALNAAETANLTRYLNQRAGV